MQWKDLNLEQRILTVSKTLIRIQNKEDNDGLKTRFVTQSLKHPDRIVPIPDLVVNELLSSFHDNLECYVITGPDHYMGPRVCLRKFKKIVFELNM